jgi:glycosyltransferase involved in cell wall biosynthesis
MNINESLLKTPVNETRNTPVLVNLSFVGQKPTGLATYAINLIPHLVLPDVTLLAPTAFTRWATVSRPHHPVPDNLSPEHGKWGHLRRLLWTQFRLPQLATQLRSPLLFSPVPEAPLFSGCRSIVVVHDFIPLRFPHWKSPLTHYFRHYLPHVLRQAEHILCNSISTANDISRFCGISAKRITPIPLAYDAEHFQCHAWPEPPTPYLLYVGRHDPYKNLSQLINAFAALPSGDHQLWIAGSSDRRYTPALKIQAQALGLSQRVRFLDYVPYADLPRLYGQATALVLPSLWEGFGFPVLEAMACGTPVIASNLSALPEVAATAAVLVDPLNEVEMTAAMQGLITDAEARSQLRAAGLLRAAQFSWAKTGQLTTEVLNQYT